MAIVENGPRAYVLREGVRIFRNNDEIRFRKGIWSYNEATIRLSGQEHLVQRFFESIYISLAQNETADCDQVGVAIGATPTEIDACAEVMESLRQQQYLVKAEEPDANRLLSALIGETLGGFEKYAGAPRSVLCFTDSAYSRSAAQTLAKEIGLPLDFIDAETLQELAQADLTSRTDAIQQIDTLTRYEKLFHPYACVVGCVASPNLSLLRNLNRLLIRVDKPLILGLIDGPFVTLLSTYAQQTGCFECFEQRMLARLEDTLVYHRFVEATAKSPARDGSRFAPFLHILTAAVLSEAYLYATLSMMRLAGRIVNVYVPLLEIQVEDLLRVPYCPACGFLSTAQMRDMYTSTKRIMTDMLNRIELIDEQPGIPDTDTGNTGGDR